MREIGSEFWEQYPAQEIHEIDSVKYLASGRTALDFIIKDALCEKTINTAFLPAYCCDSMIEPFVRNNIEVCFYKVNSDGISYDYYNNCDLVLIIDYFGFEIGENERIARLANRSGKIVIYDSTHKLNGNAMVEQWAHYSFSSYRKWFYCNFAVARKHCGAFVYTTDNVPYTHYFSLRNSAKTAKLHYMHGEAIDKSVFLSQFGEAEELLEMDYEGYSGEAVSFSMNEIIEKRRENARYLIERLLYCKCISVLTKKMLENDAPLFVPILIEPFQRPALRQHLISKDIYCPIHWPKTELQKEPSDLYGRELSLICDQRYDLSDMERIVKEIKSFFSM